MKNKKIRGKAYIKAKKLIKEDTQTIEKAVETVKKASFSKFAGTVEAKVNVNVDNKDSEQNIRFTCSIPYAFGKKKKVLAFGNFKKAEFKTIQVISATDESIDAILTNKLAPKKDFDIVVCESSYMPKLAKIARVLGPKGIMPNPKTNTVGELDKILASLDSGQVEVRLQPSNKVIHLVLGNIDSKSNEIVENFKIIIDEINKHKPSKVKKTLIDSVYLKATMSPSVKISL